MWRVELKELSFMEMALEGLFTPDGMGVVGGKGINLLDRWFGSQEPAPLIKINWNEVCSTHPHICSAKVYPPSISFPWIPAITQPLLPDYTEESFSKRPLAS